MRGFITGVVFTVVVLFAAGLIVADLGFLPTNADVAPGAFEQKVAMEAVDASIERHAPHVKNPVAVTNDNLIDSMKIYTMNCADCHGTLDYKPGAHEHSMYPPPPQLIIAPLDDPEWRTFYAIRTGIRYTGMAAWANTLSDEDMWKVTAFLSRVDSLPPGVQEYWKNAYGVSPQTGQGGGHAK
jgi:mono/diheme cytochrome c family protein